MTFQQAKINGIAYQFGGEGDEIVIGIHGWLDNSNSLAPVLSGLMSCQWFAMDLPGHGLSDWRSHDAHYYFIDYIDDVYRFIVELGLTQKVHLVGHSMGAMIAGLYSATFPEHVKSVTMIEGLSVVTTPASDTVKQLRHAIIQRRRNNEKKHKKQHRFKALIARRAEVGGFSNAISEQLMKRNVIFTEQGCELSYDPKLKHHSGFRFDLEQAHQICMKSSSNILLIQGEQGYPMVLEALNEFSKDYRELKVLRVKGGHHCHLESITEVQSIVNVNVKRFS